MSGKNYCEHIRCETVRTATGDSPTLRAIDNPEGVHTCEVCRKLATHDALLEACQWALAALDRHAGCGHVAAFLRDAIAKAEGTE